MIHLTGKLIMCMVLTPVEYLEMQNSMKIPEQFPS